MCTKELMRAIERAGSTNNIAIIKQLEQLKVSAVDRMQHYGAYMNPSTHHLQQTIYMARRNEKPVDKTDLFEIVSWTKPEDALDAREDDMACKLETYEATPTFEL
jgi:branched-chain amino acid transport system substrate-binding protein